MNNKYKTIVVAICSGLLLLSMGCATMEGMGKDVENAGEAVQDAADGE